MAYTVGQARRVLQALSPIFDVARFVNPITRKILVPEEDGGIRSDVGVCHRIWDKEQRCENCVSLKTLRCGRRMTKYEFIEEEIYHVVSKPVEIVDIKGSSTNCVLELVNRITDEVLFGAFDKDEIISRIVQSERRIYIDSLTGAYNRRYFDERIFCHNSRGELARRVAFAMMDLNRFKRINDEYGHCAGDMVLRNVSSAMMESVGKTDSVIRLGGDEFLIVLNDAGVGDAWRVIDGIREKFARDVVYDEEKGRHAIGDFGVAHTEHFSDTDECVNGLLKRADEEMYRNKQASGAGDER